MNALTGDKLLELECRKSFEYFWNEANTNLNSSGYGLVRDRAPGNPQVCSVAAVGFGLSALVIGVERKWISKEAGNERALGTLNTLLYNAEHVNGFFYHFLNMSTAKRYWNCEASIIDTSLALCGAITAGEYFGGEVREKAQRIYERVNWEWYRNPGNNRFYMGYSPEEGFFGSWDIYAEQFMMYFLGAASETHPVNPEMFYGFRRDIGSYSRYSSIVHSPNGSLFVYQFSHAWFDLRGKRDRCGMDWWRNSVLASKANRRYCTDNTGIFKTFGQNSWGLTACDGPFGYSGDYGAPPRWAHNIHDGNDGTVPPCGAAGSIVFTPDESLAALEHYYNSFPGLWGKYGFMDAYNLDVSPPWFAKDVIGIDKGITLLMIENHRTGLIWDVLMRNEYVRKGMKLAGVTEAGLIENTEVYKSQDMDTIKTL